jgi:putative oxidoreductase
MLRIVLARPVVGDLGLLLLRVLTGVLLIHHGYEKLANIENFADAFVRPLHLPFPIALSYLAAFSEVIGSWLLITGLLTRFGALAVAGTISVAIYHAIVTAGFNIYLLELLGLYFASAVAVLAMGPGLFSIDELICRWSERTQTEASIASPSSPDLAEAAASIRS